MKYDKFNDRERKSKDYRCFFCIVRSRRYLFAMFKSFESLFNLLHPKSRLQVDLCNIALLMRDVIIYEENGI